MNDKLIKDTVSKLYQLAGTQELIKEWEKLIEDKAPTATSDTGVATVGGHRGNFGVSLVGYDPAWSKYQDPDTGEFHPSESGRVLKELVVSGQTKTKFLWLDPKDDQYYAEPNPVKE